MKDVKVLAPRPFFRVPFSGAFPLTGWAIRYISGAEDRIGEGNWLSSWSVSEYWGSVTFDFDSELVMSFNREEEADHCVKTLFEHEIIVEKVKL